MINVNTELFQYMIERDYDSARSRSRRMGKEKEGKPNESEWGGDEEEKRKDESVRVVYSPRRELSRLVTIALSTLIECGCPSANIFREEEEERREPAESGY